MQTTSSRDHGQTHRSGAELSRVPTTHRFKNLLARRSCSNANDLPSPTLSPPPPPPALRPTRHGSPQRSPSDGRLGSALVLSLPPSLTWARSGAAEEEDGGEGQQHEHQQLGQGPPHGREPTSAFGGSFYFFFSFFFFPLPLSNGAKLPSGRRPAFLTPRRPDVTEPGTQTA